jgi:NAD(P)-dependent dehydrogenase (short-subunit alcohol dehydrogenase family)
VSFELELAPGRGRLKGKVAVVVGGGSIGAGWGNGKAAAVVFAREGARVLVVDYREEGAAETVRMISDAGGVAAPCVGDATTEAGVERIFETCVSEFGHVDVLHNNVGGQGTGRRIDNITLADWNETLARNLTSAMLTCQAAVPLMEKRGGGAIVNVSSISALRYLSVPTAVYSAAKGGLNEFTKNIAIQLASKRIRANCVLPGYIDTPFIRRLINGRPSYEVKGYKTAEEYAAARDAIVPLGRMGTGFDVAYASLFLLSDEASYITATTIVVDGGVTSVCPGA